MAQTGRLFGLLSVGTFLCGSAFAAVDSQLLNMVMPDAKVFAGVNATSAIISPLGQYLISKIGFPNADQQKFIAATGFNPLQNVSEILAVTTADPASPSGLIMARGTFPVDKVVALVSSMTGPTVSTYGGATLITVSNPKGNIAHAVAFVGTTVAVAGDLASVKAAIDRSTAANSIDPALAVKLNALSSSEDEWLISTASIASLLPANAAAPAQGPAATVFPLIKSVQSFNGGVKFGDNVVVFGEALTNDPKNATALSAVIKLGVTLLGSISSSGKDPQLANLVALLQNLQVTTNDTAVDLTLSVPEAQIENLLNSAKIVKPAAAAVQPRADVRRTN